MSPFFIMSTIMCNIFYSKKYQQISEIIQFHVFNTADSKKFADMSWNYDLDYTYDRLMQLIQNVNDLSSIEDKLREFVSEFFVEEDEGKNIPFLNVVQPLEFVEFLDEHLKDIYTIIHNKWYIYARRDTYSYTDKYQLDTNNKKLVNKLEPLAPKNNVGSSKIALPYLYFVPGGRFKEAYYWDSYWILIGLLSSNMGDSAFELVRSLSYLINTFDYIPNGTRQYYLGRSQPPFFGEMLKKLYDANIHRKWILSEGLSSLEKEYDWWMKNRHFDKDLRLNRYKLDDNGVPRPESFKEDLPFRNKYNDIWAAAESGWNFSTRWFKDNKSISEICTGDIIPVDLNIYLLTTEQLIISLNEEKLKRKLSETDSQILESANDTPKKVVTNKETLVSHFRNVHNDGNVDFNDSEQNNKVENKGDKIIEDIRNKIEMFTRYKNKRISDINEVFWNDELNVWLDYNTKTRTHNKAYFFSNITPLFANIPIKRGNLYNILDLYKKELFGYPGGMPASNVEPSFDGIGQQWDYPNVWAPLVQMFTEYMLDIEYPLALHVAKSFFTSVYKGMGTNRNFHEKYNCLLVGEKGKGGEYEPQEGFGWTNGTVSWMIKVFGNKLTLEDNHKDSYEKICKLIDNKKIKADDKLQLDL